MPGIQCNGVELHVEQVGTGPRLLFCNGSGTTVASSRQMLGRLAQAFELLCFDYRGMGASAPISEPYAMADVAADLIALLDRIGWDRTAIAGWSFGGMVAQELAVSHPERVQRLVLLPTSPGGSIPSFRLDTLADLPTDARTSRMLQLMDRRWTPQWLADHPNDAALAAFCASDAPAQESDAQRLGRLYQLQARKGHNVLDRLGAITAPTWVANGRFDGIAPLANGEAIVERVPQASLHAYDGGHAFFLQDPMAWDEMVSFLRTGAEPTAMAR